jgi:TatD DNase family protein
MIRNSSTGWDLIDIHAHVNFNAFKDDGPDVIKRAHDANVGMILVGSQIDTSRRAIEYAKKYESGVWASVGLHPIHLQDFSVDKKELDATDVPGFETRAEEFDYDVYKVLAEHEDVVAVGECGLDYFRLPGVEALTNKQQEVLREQIALAREVKKPLIVHCRNAYDDMARILKEEKANEVGGTIHFFVGTWDDARKFLDLGFHLSFTGVVTFTSDYDEVVSKVPLDRIMVETDAPYVAPVPFRGKRNEPLYVREIARVMAAKRGIEYEELARATTGNATKLFRL